MILLLDFVIQNKYWYEITYYLTSFILIIRDINPNPTYLTCDNNDFQNFTW